MISSDATNDIILVDWSHDQAIQKDGIQSAPGIHIRFTTDHGGFLVRNKTVVRLPGKPIARKPVTGDTDV